MPQAGALAVVPTAQNTINDRIEHIRQLNVKRKAEWARRDCRADKILDLAVAIDRGLHLLGLQYEQMEPLERAEVQQVLLEVATS